MPLVPDWSVLSSSLDILILVMPMMDLSGAGGMIRPFCRYFSASLSRSPAVPQTSSSNVDRNLRYLILFKTEAVFKIWCH
jgi:hypothetical protein